VQGLRSILAQAQGSSDEMRRQLEAQAQQLEQKRELCSEQKQQLDYLQAELGSRSAALSECRAALTAKEHANRLGEGG